MKARRVGNLPAGKFLASLPRALFTLTDILSVTED